MEEPAKKFLKDAAEKYGLHYPTLETSVGIFLKEHHRLENVKFFHLNLELLELLFKKQNIDRKHLCERHFEPFFILVLTPLYSPFAKFLTEHFWVITQLEIIC